MGSQFFTAVGAFVGTFIGIWIAETTGAGDSTPIKAGEGIFGTTVGAGELVIPMTAGGEQIYWAAPSILTLGFLYIASVSVIPDLLEESRSARQALKEVSLALLQFPFVRSLIMISTLRWPLASSAW